MASAEPPRAPRAVGWSTSRRLVAIGLAGTVLLVATVLTALVGLREVVDARADATRVTAAQRFFQDADMAHDAMRSDVVLAILQVERAGGVPAAEDSVRDLEQQTEDFGDYLRRVDAMALPGELGRALQDLRPRQDAYAEAALRTGRLALVDPAAARAALPALGAQFDLLEDEQAQITQTMADEAGRRQAVARQGEEAVRLRLVLAALGSLLGMLGLTWLLRRLGGALDTLLAAQRDVAVTLQRRLLPQRLPDVPGVRLTGRYVAGGVGVEVGGDWYDVLDLPTGELGLVIGDVVGHDLASASSMGQLRHALRALAMQGEPPDEVLQRLNRFCLQQDLEEMATVLYAVLDPVTSTLRMASAGHCPPLLVTDDERRFLEVRPGPPIGAARRADYASTVSELPPGALLLMFTDGLVERRDGDLDHGLERLRQAVVAPPPGGQLDEVCDRVLDAMLGSSAPADDVALLAVSSGQPIGARMDLRWPAQVGRLAPLRHLVERWLTEAGATQDECYDTLVAVSEAATNAVEHAYGLGPADFHVVCELVAGRATITVRDWGRWREPRGSDRGRGLLLMEGLMDDVEVQHSDRGTEVVLRRTLSGAGATQAERLRSADDAEHARAVTV